MMIMREIESTYTGFDGTKMFLRTWVPDEEPRAVIIGIHGLGSHSGLQNFIGTTFAKRGMPFYAPDLRGFGRFEGLKGHVDSFDHWIEDIHCVVKQVKEEEPHKKLFMFGHSAGGLFALYYAAKYQRELDGIITPCPAVSERLKIGAGTRMVMNLLSKLNTKKLFPTGLDLTLLARNPEVVRRNQEDPLRVDVTTPRMATEGLKASSCAVDIAPSLTLPVLIQQTGDDLILIPEKNKLFFDAVGSEDKTWKLYEGMYHQPFEDPGGEEVLSDMFSWLESHM